ncbi:MAG: hypothetical protein OSJ70_04980 [Bacilli bacterium]|nr:hypothetical protein [Bacilli bacterium]
MKDEKIVEVLKNLGYEAFKDEAEPEDLKGYEKYCVYYNDKLRKQDQHIFHQIVEFVFVNETDGEFDESEIIASLENIGLSFDDGDYGKLKKVAGGEIVNSLTLRFARPKKRKCNFY